MFERLKGAAARIKREINVLRLVAKHPKTPRLSKVLLVVALAYLLSPIDLVPDFIPVLGQFDDLIVVPGLVLLALKSVPKAVVAECREKAKAPGA